MRECTMCMREEILSIQKGRKRPSTCNMCFLVLHENRNLYVPKL